jgi:hypothetical protein
MPVADLIQQAPGSGRAGFPDAANCPAAESAQADFAFFQRRVMPIANLNQESLRPRQERLKSPLEHREVRLRGL